MKTLSKYLLFGAVAAGFWSCSSEESVEELQTSGRTVQLTVNVSREGDNAATRTEMSEANGGADLGCVWTSGDKLLVTDAQGNACGVLTLSSGDQKVEGTFSGEVTVSDNPAVSLNFIYLGTDWSDAADPADNSTWNASNGSVSLDYSTQDGSLASLTKNDLLVQTAEVAVNGKEATSEETINMDRLISFAKFSLDNLGETVKGEELGDITVSGTGLVKACSLNLSNLSVTTTTGDITISTDNPSKDFYMVLVPGAQSAFDINVKVSDGKDVYAGSYKATKKLEKGLYYRKQIAGADGAEDSYAGLPVDNWSSTPNPGNMENWGGDHGELGDVPSFVLVNGTDKDAWYSNTRVPVSGDDYGYKKPSEPRYNAISDGHLTSWIYSDGSEAKYYQWGRLLGFPGNVVYAACTMLSQSMNERYIRYPFGMSEWTDTNLYYNQDMNTRPCYSYTTTWDSGMELQQAINSSIIYLPGDGDDYLKANLRSLNWDERSGNPCPNGFRVPTKEELELFCPTPDAEGNYASFNNKHAEIKKINGHNFAVRMRRISSTTVGVVSIPTQKKTITPDDAIFSNSKELVLEANGMVYGGNGDARFSTSFDGGWKTSYYWTSTMVDVGEKSPVYYAYALLVAIKGSTVQIAMEPVEMVAGCCVVPIKDDNAKATGFQPWFPRGY